MPKKEFAGFQVDHAGPVYDIYRWRCTCAQVVGFPDTLNFIMDTGSGGISLDSTTCIRLNILPVLTDKLIMGIGGVRQLRYVNNRSLIFGSLRIDSLNFHVSDYDILSSVYGDRIDGIIGYSFFTRYIVKIDYDSSQMYVYSNGTMKYPKGGFILKRLVMNLRFRARCCGIRKYPVVSISIPVQVSVCC